MALLETASMARAAEKAAEASETASVCGAPGSTAPKQVSRTTSEPSVATWPAGGVEAAPDTNEMNLPAALMAGEKFCVLLAAVVLSFTIRVVDGTQPSGAVPPRQVSRRYARLRWAAFPVEESGGCDSKTTKRASLLSDGEIFTPPRVESSGA